MQKPPLGVKRSHIRLVADPARVITRPFIPGGDQRIDDILARIMALDESQVASLLNRIQRDYSTRHYDLDGVFDRHFDLVRTHLGDDVTISQERRRLIGAYFTLEYALESVALFNPSMVLDPDQSGTNEGSTRFVMSLRACGEGHISSIEFRRGTIDPQGDITMDPIGPFAATEQPIAQKCYDKNTFYLKLIEIGAYDPLADRVLDRLGDQFTVSDLQATLDELHWTKTHVDRFHDLANDMLWLAHSTYELHFPDGSALSERVIFPVTENESRGIEDARFVRFTHDDGRVVYYATYTAYNGFRTLPQLIETDRFAHFSINTMNGSCVQNKGMALFPRRLGSSFVMLARLDGENVYLLRSDNLYFWNESEKLHGPTNPWEFIQVGNCGSPVETEAGWLVLTHGVGAVREYWIGAMLLDRDDPSRVIGTLSEPLLTPTADERNGYVPNVVYSCGPMMHNGWLVIPYAVADTSTKFATVAVDELLDRMRPR